MPLFSCHVFNSNMPSPKDLMDKVVAKHQQNPRLDAIRAEVQTTPFLKSHRILEGAQITLRLVATFTATLCILTSHQSTVILGMNFDARYSYSPAFKFFAFGNAIACIFVLVTLLQPLSYTVKIILVLVTAGCAAATAIGNVVMHGNPHTGWAPICDHFRKICQSHHFHNIFLCISRLLADAYRSVCNEHRRDYGLGN